MFIRFMSLVFFVKLFEGMLVRLVRKIFLKGLLDVLVVVILLCLMIRNW